MSKFKTSLIGLSGIAFYWLGTFTAITLIIWGGWILLGIGLLGIALPKRMWFE